MQKFYSIVLMATALLVGTNVNAKSVTVPSTDYPTLAAAFSDADVTEITLAEDIDASNYGSEPIKIFMASASAMVTLNLNNHKIETSSSTATFYFYRGHLKVTGKGEITNTYGKSYDAAKGEWTYGSSTVPTGWQRKGNKMDGFYIRPKDGQAFYLAGADAPTDVVKGSTYTWLEIGEDVTVTGHAIGIYTDKNQHNSFVGNYDNLYPQTNNGKTKDEGTAFGVRVDMAGKVYGKKYAMQLSGNIGFVPSFDVDGNYMEAMPIYNITGTAAGNVDADWSSAIYGGGWSVWNITGKEALVYGTTGVFVKAGQLNIKDATVYSNSTLDYSKATGSSGIDHAAGSAVVLNSNSTYPGEITVTISGEATIGGNEGKGYALETYDSKGDNEVKGLTIEGGTFVTGENAKGCVDVASVIPAAMTDDATIILTGGNFDADIQDVIDVAANKDVIIGQNVDGGYVITPNESGDPVEKNGPLDGTKKNLVWEGQDRELAAGANVEIDYLSMGNDASDKPSTLIIRSGATLKVGAIVMSKASVLTVEPGAKLILTQSNGIVANKAENFILQANGTAAAMLLLSPDVKTNRQPMATVEMKTPNAYQIDATNKKWVRFASPMAEVASFASDKASVTHELYEGETTLLTDIEYWDYSKGDWKELKALSEYKPFVMYFLTNNTTSADAIAKNGVKYTFKGKLQGNVTDNIQFGGTNFNYFANTFTAPMGIEALLAQFESNGVVEKTVWVWNAASQSFEDWNLTKIALKKANGFDYAKELSAIESFVCKLPATALNKESINLNYAASVWGYNMGGTSQAAPARVREMNSMKTAQINVLAVDGTRDNVTLIESENFNSEFENGSDASKWMSDEVINLYINGVENLGTIATDNLNGTMLSLQTRDAEQFTLSFSDVAGEGMAIKDMVTGIVTEIKEGNTYQFRADANANNDYRFQIIGVNNAPTDVETIEANEGVSAVYTILGQYVGTSDMINALPAGVYVIDGVKIVK